MLPCNWPKVHLHCHTTYLLTQPNTLDAPFSFTSCYKPALWQAVTPPAPEFRAMWTQPKLNVSSIQLYLRLMSWDMLFSKAGFSQNSLMWISSFLREAGTSVDKKNDGECKKEDTTVSELCDKGPCFSPADVRLSTVSVCSSPQTNSIPQECSCCCASAQGRYCFFHT